MATGRHAQGKGRHRKPPAPRPMANMLLLLATLTLLAVFLPVVAGIGLVIGVLFGWMTRAVTKA